MDNHQVAPSAPSAPSLTVSVTEAARLLGISTPTLWRLLRLQQIGHIPLGVALGTRKKSRILIPRAELDGFMRRNLAPAVDTVAAPALPLGKASRGLKETGSVQHPTRKAGGLAAGREGS